MIKAILMIQNGCILPNAGFEEFNQNIEGREKLRVCPDLLATILAMRDEKRSRLTSSTGSPNDDTQAA
jgi:hypothetical protein